MIPTRKVPVPLQENGSDCGLFLLYYIQKFVERAPGTLKISDVENRLESIGLFGRRWFLPTEASSLRTTIRQQLLKLFAQDAKAQGIAFKSTMKKERYESCRAMPVMGLKKLACSTNWRLGFENLWVAKRTEITDVFHIRQCLDINWSTIGRSATLLYCSECLVSANMTLDLIKSCSSTVEELLWISFFMFNFSVFLSQYGNNKSLCEYSPLDSSCIRTPVWFIFP